MAKRMTNLIIAWPLGWAKGPAQIEYDEIHTVNKKKHSQAKEQRHKQTSKQTNKHASKQTNKQTTNQTNKQWTIFCN